MSRVKLTPNCEECVHELELNYVILKRCCGLCRYYRYSRKLNSCICTLAPEPTVLKVKFTDYCHWKHNEFELSREYEEVELKYD